MEEENNNWFMYHGSYGHGGYVSGGQLNSEFVGDNTQFGLLTSIETQGSILSVPAIVDNHIYVGLANSRNAIGSNGGTLQKYDITNGTLMDEFTWSIDVNERDVHGFTGMGCTPTVINNCVYFIGFDAVLYCLDANNLKSVIWKTDLRHPDLNQNQPIDNTGGPHGIAQNVPAEGWSSPLVIDISGKPHVIVGIGEGENPFLMSFIFCLDATSGKVVWVYCTCQFEKGVDNLVNHIPAAFLSNEAASMFTKYEGKVAVQGSSVWSAIAYDQETGMIYAGMGQPASPADVGPAPDYKPVPAGTGIDKGLNDSPGYTSGILALDAATGNFKAFRQMEANTSYRPKSDYDVDIGSAPTIYTIPDGTDKGKKVVGIGCKNGGFMICDATNLNLITSRSLLPYFNDNYTLTIEGGNLPECQTPQENWAQIPTVDPHPANVSSNPFPDNDESNANWNENFSGPFNTAAVDPANGIIFIGLGGPNYHAASKGIDYKNTPFMRAIKWDTLEDAWPMSAADETNPRRYTNTGDSMYNTPGECGLSSPAVVNDVVFVTTTKVDIYAFKSKDGTLLYSNNLGNQTGGMQGGYGYSLGPAIYKDYVVAGGLVQAMEAGGVLNIYGPLSEISNYPS